MNIGREYVVKLGDLRRMREAGMGCWAIAKVYGCDQSTVRHWLIRFGLPTQRQNPSPPMDEIERAIRSAEAKRKYRLRHYPRAIEIASLPKPKVDADA